MTCPAKQFGCGCDDGTCQVPNHRALEAARVSSTAHALMHALIAGVIVAASCFAIIATANVYFPFNQELSR